jgi:hypothetical protein
MMRQQRGAPCFERKIGIDKTDAALADSAVKAAAKMIPPLRMIFSLSAAPGHDKAQIGSD